MHVNDRPLPSLPYRHPHSLGFSLLVLDTCIILIVMSFEIASLLASLLVHDCSRPKPPSQMYK